MKCFFKKLRKKEKVEGVEREERNVKPIEVVMSAIIVIAIILFFTLAKLDIKSYEQPYNVFMEALNRENVCSIAMINNRVEWQLKGEESRYYTYISSIDETTELVNRYISEHYDVQTVMSNNTITSDTKVRIIASIIPCIILLWIYRRFKGKENAQFQPVTSKTKFSDVAGIEEEKEQLIEIVDFLKNSRRYKIAGAKLPKGVLLYGKPGTGKTLLAKAIAGEAKVPFFSLNGSSFEEKYVGVGASRIRELFKEAKKHAPSIIFIDEFESIACKRFSNSGMKNEQTLNQLLAEMDGFDSSDDVIVIAATNHIKLLDPAITRPGRFDRRIYIPKPNIIEREKILKVHLKDKKIAGNVNLKLIAKKTSGFSGADLANILNEAAILAVKDKRYIISACDIDEAIAKVLVGLKRKNEAITKKDKWIIAIHEAGHAVTSRIFRPEIKNFGISIVPRENGIGGYNQFDNYKACMQKADFLKEIMVLYGGRVAEEIIIKDISIGACNDLERASQIVFNMLTKYSMGSQKITLIDDKDINKLISNNILIEAENICKDCYLQVHSVLYKNKYIIIELAKKLMSKEYIDEIEIEKFFKDNL